MSSNQQRTHAHAVGPVSMSAKQQQRTHAHAVSPVSSASGDGANAATPGADGIAFGRPSKRRKVSAGKCCQNPSCALLRHIGFEKDVDDPAYAEQRAKAFIAGILTRVIPKRPRDKNFKKLMEVQELLSGNDTFDEKFNSIIPVAFRVHQASAGGGASKRDPPLLNPGRPISYSDYVPQLESLAKACYVDGPAYILKDKTIAPPSTLVHQLDMRSKKSFQLRPNSDRNPTGGLRLICHPEYYCISVIKSIPKLLGYIQLRIGFKKIKTKTKPAEETPSPQAFLNTPETMKARDVLLKFAPAVNCVNNSVNNNTAAQWWAQRLSRGINTGIKRLAINEPIPKKRGRERIPLTEAQNEKAVRKIAGIILDFFGVSLTTSSSDAKVSSGGAASGKNAVSPISSEVARFSDNTSEENSSSFPSSPDPSQRNPSLTLQAHDDAASSNMSPLFQNEGEDMPIPDPLPMYP